MSARLSVTPASYALFLAVVIHCPGASAQGFFLTPVANAPFSAVVNVDRTVVGNDGSIQQFTSTRAIARDTRGRIHNEMRTFVPGSGGETPELLIIHLYDPQSRLSTEIDVKKRTFSTMTVNHPPSTEPPSIRFADPEGNAPPNEFTHEEDLGIRDIEGVPARGVRETQTVTDESTGKEVLISDEYWYSQDLRINLMIKHSDPRKGTNTLTVSQVTRTEPDSTFFEVPADYTRPGAQPGTPNAN